MVVLRTNKDLFMTVHRMYGHSVEWLSGMALEIGVSYNTARHLALECGYSRHKLLARVELDAFTRSPYASLVIRSKGLEIV